jgi:predicted metalloprotease with PDZ domain
MIKNKKLVYGIVVGIAICAFINIAATSWILPLSSPGDKSKIDYSISLGNSEEKIINVTCKLDSLTLGNSTQFVIEKQHNRFYWYPDYIQNFTVSNLKGELLGFKQAEYDNRTVWTVFDSSQPILVRYTVKLTHLDDAIARYGPYEHGIGVGALPFMEENYGYITGRAVFIVPDINEEKEALDIIVHFDLPLDWKVDSSWEEIAENGNSFRVKKLNQATPPGMGY